VVRVRGVIPGERRLGDSEDRVSPCARRGGGIEPRHALHAPGGAP
jgi:hypothetical protein